MASTYTISAGDGTLALNDVSGTYVAMQVTADSALNADVVVKLQHTADGVNYFDLPNTEKTLASGGDSVYIESYDYTLDNLVLNIDVGSATLGTLDVLPSIKKKIDSDVNATIVGDIQTIADSNLLEDTDDIKSNTQLLNGILKQLKQINKTLIKIYQ